MPLADEPVPQLRDSLGARRLDLDFVSRAPRRLLLRNASSAIYQGLRALIRPGRARVLVPAYHCGEEVEAIVRAGGLPDFYRIDRCCRPDLEDLSSRLRDDTAAIFVVHYNGFPQPVEEMRALAEQRGVHLVEDCAHVLRTEHAGRLLGGFGTFAAFSLRKYLPVTTGGLLAINDPGLADTFSVALQGRPGLLGDAARLVKRRWRARRPPLPDLRTAPTRTARPVHAFGAESLAQPISSLSRRVLERADLAAVVRARRRNYAQLASALCDAPHLRSLQPPLPAGVCPLWYLAEVEDPWRLHRALAERGVGSTVFWSHFHPRFPDGDHPEAEALKSRVLALPIHQGLSEADVTRLADSVLETI